MGDKAPRDCPPQAEKTLRRVVGRDRFLLGEREAEVVRLRFGIDGGQPMTLEDIGARFGITRERVRQIEQKAMRKLRHPSRRNQLQDYLES